LSKNYFQAATGLKHNMRRSFALGPAAKNRITFLSFCYSIPEVAYYKVQNLAIQPIINRSGQESSKKQLVKSRTAFDNKNIKTCCSHVHQNDVCFVRFPFPGHHVFHIGSDWDAECAETLMLITPMTEAFEAGLPSLLMQYK
jgi:hypothetical protein